MAKDNFVARKTKRMLLGTNQTIGLKQLAVQSEPIESEEDEQEREA